MSGATDRLIIRNDIVRNDEIKITPRYTGQELWELRATERPTDWPFSGCVTLSVSRWGLKGNQGPPPGVGEPEKGVSREREARGEAGRTPLRSFLPTLSTPFPAPCSSSSSSPDAVGWSARRSGIRGTKEPSRDRLFSQPGSGLCHPFGELSRTYSVIFVTCITPCWQYVIGMAKIKAIKY